MLWTEVCSPRCSPTATVLAGWHIFVGARIGCHVGKSAPPPLCSVCVCICVCIFCLMVDADADIHRWGYYSARMRSAIALSNHSGLEFSGYIVVGSSGDQDGGLLQRVIGLAGMGSKLIRYYNFGPSQLCGLFYQLLTLESTYKYHS